MDYPNSKKARKVFLVLFVGGGGGAQQVPEALDGEEREEGKVRFERRREREGKRDKSGKRKSLKGKDWILKKKEVSGFWCRFNIQTDKLPVWCSYIDNAGKKESLETQNSQVASEKRYSD